MKKIIISLILLTILIISGCDKNEYEPNELKEIVSNHLNTSILSNNIPNGDKYILGKYGEGYVLANVSYEDPTIMIPSNNQYNIEDICFNVYRRTDLLYFNNIDKILVDIRLAYQYGYLVKEDIVDLKEKIEVFENNKVAHDFDMKDYNNKLNRHKHTVKKWEVEQPTCTAQGVSRGKCDYCDSYTVKYKIDMIEHEYVDGRCKTCGFTGCKDLKENQEVSQLVKESYPNYSSNFIAGVTTSKEDIYLYEITLSTNNYLDVEYNIINNYVFYHMSNVKLLLVANNEVFELQALPKRGLDVEATRILYQKYKESNSFDTYMYENYDSLKTNYSKEFYKNFHSNMEKSGKEISLIISKQFEINHLYYQKSEFLIDDGFLYRNGNYLGKYNDCYVFIDALKFQNLYVNKEKYNVELGTIKFIMNGEYSINVFDGESIFTLKEAYYSNKLSNEDIFKIFERYQNTEIGKILGN